MQNSTTSASEITKENHFEESRIEQARCLAGLFGFFSRCFEEEADATLIDLVRGELHQSLTASGLIFDDEFYDIPTESLVETLAEEYTGLFVAPGCVSPYASVVQTGCLFKKAADRAINSYHKAGWNYQHRLSGEFPDHIGTMLGFYANLAESEADALTAGDISRADDSKMQRDEFLLKQLAEWGPGWCQRAANAALHPFYRKLLQMTEQALWLELEQLVDRRRMRELVDLNQQEPKRLDYDADFRKASGL